MSFSGELDQVSEELSELLIFFVLVVEESRGNVILDVALILLEVLGHGGEVLQWVRDEGHGFGDSAKVELGLDDCLADWETLLELLVGTNSTDDDTNGITKSILPGLVTESLLKSLVSNVKHKGSLIFLVDAEEKVLDVDLSTESIEETGLDGSILLSLE